MKAAERPYSFFILALILALLTILVGGRDISFGTDTANYVHYFNLLQSNRILLEHELIFHNLSLLIFFISDRPEVYLGTIFLLFNIALINVYRIGFGFRQHIYLFALFGFLLISSWYLTATVNALRQGLSLPFLYAAVLFVAKKEFIKSVIFLVIAINIHYSSALIVPFIAIMMLNIRYTFYIFALYALLYISGISDVIFKGIAFFVDPSIYYRVIDYGSAAETGYSFSYAFAFYSSFWGVIYYYARGFLNNKNLEVYDNILKCYFVLMMPYFAFAHGNYSNRYAFIGWLFLPFLHTSFLISLSLSRFHKVLFSIFILTVGLLYYIAILTELIAM